MCFGELPRHSIGVKGVGTGSYWLEVVCWKRAKPACGPASLRAVLIVFVCRALDEAA
jgi:hypothetical protein